MRVLETCSRDALIAREQVWMDSLGAFVERGGFNMLPQASNRAGSQHSEATKEKLRRIKSHTTEETRRRMQEAKKGTTRAPEVRASIAANHARTKLSEAQVRAIIAAYGPSRGRGKHAGITTRELAETYGVSNHQISVVVAGKTHLSARVIGEERT
jgi:hypothetical protein